MQSVDDDHDALQKLRRVIHGSFKKPCNDYDVVRDKLYKLHSLLRNETASILEPVLNERAKQTPHATYEQKKALALWLNADLREFGLAIECPRTGHPTFLQANPSHNAERGRFRLDRMDEQHRYTTTYTSVEMPAFKLRSATRITAPRRSGSPHSR